MMFNRVSRVIIHNEPVGWCEICTTRGITPLEYAGSVVLDYLATVLGATVPTVLCPKCFVAFREAGEAHRPRVENCIPHPSEWGGVTPEWEHLHTTPNTSSNVTHMGDVDAIRSRALWDALTSRGTTTTTHPPLLPTHLRDVYVPIPTLIVQDDYRRYALGDWSAVIREVRHR